MFGLSFWEILVVLIVAVVLINPKDLPAVFRRVGRVYGQLRALNHSLTRTMRDLDREVGGEPPKGQAQTGARAASGKDEAPGS